MPSPSQHTPSTSDTQTPESPSQASDSIYDIPYIAGEVEVSHMQNTVVTGSLGKLDILIMNQI